MRRANIGAVPVVTDMETRKLEGILTDRDLAIKVVAEGRDPRSTRVEEVMESKLVSCRPEDDVAKALDVMARTQVRRVPVVDENGSIRGIIAQADVATRLGEPARTGEVVEEISS